MSMIQVQMHIQFVHKTFRYQKNFGTKFRFFVNCTEVLVEGNTKKVPRDDRNSKVRKHAKFRRNWFQHKNRRKSQNGTGPGIWRIRLEARHFETALYLLVTSFK